MCRPEMKKKATKELYGAQPFTVSCQKVLCSKRAGGDRSTGERTSCFSSTVSGPTGFVASTLGMLAMTLCCFPIVRCRGEKPRQGTILAPRHFIYSRIYHKVDLMFLLDVWPHKPASDYIMLDCIWRGVRAMPCVYFVGFLTIITWSPQLLFCRKIPPLRPATNDAIIDNVNKTFYTGGKALISADKGSHVSVTFPYNLRASVCGRSPKWA